MNKYIISKRNALVKLDTDKLDVDHIDHSYDIDRIWFIEEDGVIVREGEEYEVKKDAVVLLMYRIGGEGKGEIIIINNNDLSNFYERKKEYIEKERNRVSGEKVYTSCDSCCKCAG
jgi:hypothetical protein